MPNAQSTVTMESSKFKIARKRGTLVDPVFFPSKIVITAMDEGADELFFEGGFKTDGTTPGVVGVVKFQIVGVFALSVAGDEFERKGDKFIYKTSGDGTSISMTIDFLKEVIIVKTTGIEVGTLTAPVTDVLFDCGGADGPVDVRVVISVKNTKRFY